MPSEQGRIVTERSEREPRRKWKHRTGDHYIAVFGDFQGNPDDGYSFEWWTKGPLRTTRNLAERDGFKAMDSDDFCIAVVRPVLGRARVVAVLWMDEDKDEDQEVLDELTELICV